MRYLAPETAPTAALEGGSLAAALSSGLARGASRNALDHSAVHGRQAGLIKAVATHRTQQLRRPAPQSPGPGAD